MSLQSEKAASRDAETLVRLLLLTGVFVTAAVAFWQCQLLSSSPAGKLHGAGESEYLLPEVVVRGRSGKSEYVLPEVVVRDHRPGLPVMNVLYR
jgi:hypothetical protein